MRSRSCPPIGRCRAWRRRCCRCWSRTCRRSTGWPRSTSWPRHLAEGTVALRDVAARVLAKQPGTDRLLLFVDQWEELYTLCADERPPAFVGAALEAAAASGAGRAHPARRLLRPRARRPGALRPAAGRGRQHRADDPRRARGDDHPAGGEGGPRLRAGAGRDHPRRCGRGAGQPAAAGVPAGGACGRSAAARSCTTTPTTDSAASRAPSPIAPRRCSSGARRRGARGGEAATDPDGASRRGRRGHAPTSGDAGGRPGGRGHHPQAGRRPPGGDRAGRRRAAARTWRWRTRR